MKRKIVALLLLAAAAGFAACVSQDRAEEPAAPGTGICKTAREVIEKNLAAIGGRERIRNVRAMTVKGSYGSTLLPSGQEVTLYLERPDRMKQDATFRVLLSNGNRLVYNNGGTEVQLPPENVKDIRYRIGFYHDCFSLLKWEEAFPRAELLEVKEYGPVKQYAIRFPGAEEGEDLLAYVDADTFLVDRLVYTVPHPDARELKVVNQLRDYETFEGIRFPTRVIFDKVGWEAGPNQLVIREVEINPDLEPGLFDSAEIEFGSLVREGDAVRGEIFGIMDGTPLTNVRPEDLAAIGIRDKDWVNVEVGEVRMKVRLLVDIQRSPMEIKPEELYLCGYPISGYPRLMLMDPGGEAVARVPCEKGDTVVVTRAEGGE
jgi:hypothetical protein